MLYITFGQVWFAVVWLYHFRCAVHFPGDHHRTSPRQVQLGVWRHWQPPPAAGFALQRCQWIQGNPRIWSMKPMRKWLPGTAYWNYSLAIQHPLGHFRPVFFPHVLSKMKTWSALTIFFIISVDPCRQKLFANRPPSFWTRTPFLETRAVAEPKTPWLVMCWLVQRSNAVIFFVWNGLDKGGTMMTHWCFGCFMSCSSSSHCHPRHRSSSGKRR